MPKPENREIIYLAICNQIQIYNYLLEQGDLDTENKGMAEYILKESLKIADNMSKELQSEKPISRPIWNQK